MPRITFIDHLGEERSVAGIVGQSIMEVAKRHDVDGIIGECGGSRACATCHVYVAPEWQAAVGEMSEDEDDLLDFTFDRKGNSRLSCQIRLRPALDGLVVRIPVRQK